MQRVQAQNGADSGDKKMIIPETFILTVSNESLKSLFPWLGSNKSVCKDVEKPWADNAENWGIRPENSYEIEAKAFYFDVKKLTCYDRILKKMKDEGFVPGNLRHLLSVRKQFPNLKVTAEIVALGSMMTFIITGSRALALATDANDESIVVKLTRNGMGYYPYDGGTEAIFLGVKADSESEQE